MHLFEGPAKIPYKYSLLYLALLFVAMVVDHVWFSSLLLARL
ncbi:hypothetical protein BH10CHL1_BH10CHL1_50630 [soil metagenome]